MIRAKILFPVLLMSLFLLVACQPQLFYVDVTRLVEITPAHTSGVEQTPVIETAEAREVTRIISQEVTRVITSTIVEEVSIEVTRSPLGSAERPVQLLFSPMVNTAVISSRGQVLVDALTQETGVNFEVGILDDELNIVQLMCTAPEETIGFLSSIGYVLAHELCDTQIGNVAIQSDGLKWQAGMIVARRDSGITSLEDLVGKRWAVADRENISQFHYFQALFAEAGVETGEILDVPGDSSAMLAVYNREVDFATASYIPPILPYDERPWQYGEDSPEIWRRLGIPPTRSPIGYVLVMAEPEFGGYRLRDARSNIFDIEPGIYNETVIVELSAPIPNDTIAFGANFPLGLSRQVIALMIEFSSSEACITSLCSTDFLGWIGMEASEDTDYDPLRFVAETLNLNIEEMLEP